MYVYIWSCKLLLHLKYRIHRSKSRFAHRPQNRSRFTEFLNSYEMGLPAKSCWQVAVIPVGPGPGGTTVQYPTWRYRRPLWVMHRITGCRLPHRCRSRYRSINILPPTRFIRFRSSRWVVWPKWSRWIIMIDQSIQKS